MITNLSMKLKKLFGGLFLSFALIASVGAGLLVKEAKENATYEKTEAESVPMGIYVAFGNSSSWKTWGATLSNISVYFYGGTFGNPDWSEKYNVDTSSGYVATPEKNSSRPTNCIICAWGGGNNNQTDDLTLQTDGKCVFTISGNVSGGKQPGSWGTKSSTTTKTLYIDASNWVSGMGNYTPQCHFWDNQYSYDNVSGTNITSVSGGGTYSNKKWWSFSITFRDSGSLKFLFMYNNYAMQTADISYNASNNAYYLNGTKSAAPDSAFSSTGTIYKITKYKKLGTASSTVYGTDYLLGGESYQVPAIPSAQTGYTAPSKWNTSEAGTGTAYAKDEWISNVTANKTLYALYSVATYTMTFKPNGGGGSEVTRQKTHGESFTVPTPESLGISAGAARVMLSWNENQDGSGTSYKIDGTSTYTGNSAKTFWLQQGFKSYEYSVDGGSTWVQMPQVAAATDCIATYESSASNYLPAGQAITIRGYYGSGTHSAQSINNWSGNQYESGGSHYVSIGTYNKIVLYVTNSGNFNIDVWGGSARGVAIDRDGFVTKYECQLNETTHNFTGTVTVLPGDKIEAYYNFATVYAITMTNYASYGIDVNGNVSVPAVYVLTVTYKSADNYPTINVDSMVAVDTAKLIAQTFNDDMTPLCTAVEGGTDPSSLVTKWGVESGYYSKLSSATKNILNGTTSSSDVDVLAMRAKYDRIVGKYKGRVTGITDYMSRNPAAIGMGFGYMPLELLTSDANGTPMLVIIIVSIVSVTAVGGYFFLRKRRNEK